jgi:hypothetical protein
LARDQFQETTPEDGHTTNDGKSILYGTETLGKLEQKEIYNGTQGSIPAFQYSKLWKPKLG